ncbi:MAG: monophosphatase [Pseudonocardiales bacterium]|nr:monophosphatase [Pseudonocardiales bacterium]
MNRDLADVVEQVADIAERTGRLQLERRGSLVVRGTKAHLNDLVSDVDLASEQLITDAITAAWPDDGILGEEGHDTAGTSGWRWIVDPLDGTRNYVTASGPWSVSIALYEGDRPVVGVVHDPVLGETFTAAAGAGARLNGEPIAVADPKGLDEAILGLSFNPSPAVKQQVAEMLGRVLPVIGDLRRVPAALNLAYLAVGRTDASVLVDAKIWDVAAGLVIAAEAGAHPGGRADDLLVLAAAPSSATELTALVTPR